MLYNSLAKYITGPWSWVLGPWILGLFLSIALPTREHGLPPTIDLMSRLIGWTYFSAWSLSFYPQIILNFSRKSVVGLSLDFQLLNLVGFSCYAIYNCALYWSSTVRREYADDHRGQLPAVRANDVFFSLHAALITMITLLQCYMYDKGEQTFHKRTVAATIGAAGAAVVSAFMIPIRAIPVSWLDWIYFLSFLKFAISLTKYIPQVILNCSRKSTVGWSLWNVMLDFEGGALSLAQLLIDSGATHDWSAVTGNVIKFCLGFVSMAFDIIFIVQHFILFSEAAPVEEQELLQEGSNLSASSSSPTS